MKGTISRLDKILVRYDPKLLSSPDAEKLQADGLTVKLPRGNISTDKMLDEIGDAVALSGSKGLNGSWICTRETFPSIWNSLRAWKAARASTALSTEIADEMESQHKNDPPFDVRHSSLWLTSDPAGYGTARQVSFHAIQVMLRHPKEGFWIYQVVQYCKEDMKLDINEVMTELLVEAITELEARLDFQFPKIYWIHEVNGIGNLPLEIPKKLHEVLSRKLMVFRYPNQNLAGVCTGEFSKRLAVFLMIKFFYSQGLSFAYPGGGGSIALWRANANRFGYVKAKTRRTTGKKGNMPTQPVSPDDVMATVITFEVNLQKTRVHR